MKILFITFGDEQSPSSRYRVYQYIDRFITEGCETTLVKPQKGESALKLTLRAYNHARNADIVFLQKRLLPKICLHLLSKAVKGRLIYDFDDALFAIHNRQRRTFTQKRVVSRLINTLRLARVVIAGNEYLAQYARSYNDNVEIIPTAIELSTFPRRSLHIQKETQVVGWVGTSSNHCYLAGIGEVLAGLCNKRHTILRVVSNTDFLFPNLEVENIRWSPKNEAKSLHKFDIGLMPLEDNDWTRGKCAYKALQYMAVGIPVVCSPVGMNREVIRDGVEGFFADSYNEWLQTIELLLNDAALREKTGKAGRERIINCFSTEAIFPRLATVIQRTAKQEK